MKVIVFDDINEAAAVLRAMLDPEQGTIPDPRQLELPLDQPTKAAKPAKRRTAVEPISSSVIAPDQPEEPLDAARERLRALAKEKGVVWLRSTLEAYGVQRLSDLSDAQVREILRAQ